jgi:hypothetical protein
MSARLKGLRLLALAAPLAAGLAFASPSQAAPQPASAQRGDSCPVSRNINNWRSTEQLERQGFHVELFGDQGSLSFERERGQRYAALDLAADPADSTYTASRISEIDGTLPIAERTKCWEASERRAVVSEFTLRFDQAATPALTENLFFWNSPLPAVGASEPTLPLTAFGISRSQGVYQAVALQDLDFSTFTWSLYQTQPMPTWLNADDWHRVRVTISQTAVRIEVAQGRHSFTPVLEAALPHPAEPLGFEVSIDNEASPGVYAPVITPDGIDIEDLEIRLRRSSAD